MSKTSFKNTASSYLVLLPSGIMSQKKFYKAYSVLGINKRNFIYVDTFIVLYKSMVRRVLNLQIWFGAL